MAARLIVFVVVLIHCQLSVERYARLYDGNSYLINAEAMTGDWREFNAFHGRVFPGYPAMIALLHQLHHLFPMRRFAVAAIAIDWVSAAAAAVFAAELFCDRRVGFAMAFLIPHYLMNSSLAMSEAPLLAFTLGGLLMVRRSRICGGGLLGAASLVRPMACFAGAGYAFAEFASKRVARPSGLARLARVGVFTLSAAVVVLIGLLLVHRWRGTALAGARYYASSPNAYDGQLITWPFRALLTTPFRRHVPVGRVLYIYAHVAVTVTACGLLARKVFQTRQQLDWRDALAGPWLLGNTIFVLCTGSIWGFECFHRFTIPALPAMFWALQTVLPTRRRYWVIIAIGSMTVAILTITHDFFTGGCR